MDIPWPFDQPPNCAVISTCSIMSGDAAVLLVTHDDEDDGWQFLAGGELHMADAVVMSLKSMVDRDTSLLELADLPPGWQASRGATGAAWIREQSPPEREGA
jgi:hypothetical protein